MLRRQYFDLVPSTQEPALELARHGAAPGTSIVAAQQTIGRGRLDHSWASPPGGLYMSIVREGCSEAGPLLSISVAAGLSELFAERWQAPVRIRWPNDLVCPTEGSAAKKLGGVLLETVHGSDGYRTVVGIGVNVQAPLAAFPPELRNSVCSLREHAPEPPELHEVEAAVADRVAELFRDLAGDEGQARWRAVARARFYGHGLPARIDGKLVGVVEGIADDGALIVRNGPTMRNYYEGTLSLKEGS